MYLKYRYVAGETIEIQKTYSARAGKGYTRGERVAPTPEKMERYNQKMAARELTRLINANFTQEDMYLTLTYRRGERPEPAAAQKQVRKLLRGARKKAREGGAELKYILVTAIGERGAIHHHVILSGVDLKDLRGLWPYGGIHAVPLYSNREYSGLALYLIEQESKGPTGQRGIIGRRWSGSRNLIRPEPQIREVDADTWQEPPEPEKGYVIDIPSIEAGTSPVTGIPYLFYRMIRIPDKLRVTDESGAILTGAAAAAWLRRENKKHAREEVRRQYAEGDLHKPKNIKRRKRHAKQLDRAG